MTLRLTLRHRIVMLVVVAIVPLLGMALINAWRNADAAVSRAADNLRFAASLVAGSQDRMTESAHQLLMAIANAPGLESGHAADCQRYLKTLMDQFPVYANLGLIGADGYLRCDGIGRGSQRFVGDRDYFQAAMTRRTFVAGGYIVGRIQDKPVVTFAMPVMNTEGRVTAVAFVAVDLNEMSKAVVDAPLPQGSQVLITDSQGIVLAAGPEKSALVGLQVPSPLLQAAVKTMHAGVGDGLDAKGRQRIFAFLPAGKAANAVFFVAVSADRDGVLAPVHTQLKRVLILLALVAFVCGWLAWRMGWHYIVKPTMDILEAIRQIRNDRLDARIPVPLRDDGGEFSRIAAGFNLMADSLQRQQGALEAELSSSLAAQEKLRDAQNLARIGYWQIDLATRQLSWSDEVYKLFDIDAAQFDGTYQGFLNWIHPSDREAFTLTRDAAIQFGAPLEREFRIITPKGQTRWIHQFGRPLVNRNGEPSTRCAGVVQDITERKDAELAMARNTELLNRTGALARVGGWELVVDTMTRYWSAEMYRIYDLDPSLDINFEESVSFFGIEAQPVIRAAVKAAMQDATPWDMELPLVTARGKPLWVRTQGRALLENGKVVRLVGVLQDMTEQHQAQEHLRLLETCIARLNDMVVITGPMTATGPGIVFVNDAFKRQTGYSREEVVGKAPGFLRGPKTQLSELQRVGAALRNGQPVRAELINYTKSGREFWLELDIVPVSDAKGDIIHWVAVERDITQRKLAEQALMDSEQRYAALFETAPVPMWVYDIATARFLAVNRAAVQAYGYSAAEFLSMTIFDIRPAAEHEKLRQWLDSPSWKKALWHDLRKDASLFSVETVSQPIQYAGQAARLVVVMDKTAQDKAEKEMQEYLFTLQRAADAAQAITWHQTVDGTMQEIAQQARGVIGAHQAMVSLKADGEPLQMLHALSLSEKYEADSGLIRPADGSGIYAMVCDNNRLVRLTQAELEAHPRWHDFGGAAGEPPLMRGWLAVPLIGKNGKNIGMLQLSDKYEGEFTKQDEYVALELSHLASAGLENSRLLEEISQLNAGLEQKVAERTVALARQEALFRALAEQAPQLVWTASPDGAATYFNRAWFDLMGGELNAWTGLQWLAVVHPDDVSDIKSNWKIARANQSSYAGVRRLLAKDGSCHTMAYRGSPVLDAKGEVAFWVGIDADITEIKAIEAALRLSNQELEAFSYSVSHDLRSPLSTVDGFSRLLAKQLAGDTSAKVNHYLTRIQAGVAQMGRLIEDLLSLSQVTRARLHTERVDLSLMAHNLLDEWQTRQPERQVAVSIEEGLQAQGDGPLLRVVMENLLANAWKFTSHMAQATISVGQTSDAAGLPVFFVKDNGAGFDMAYSDKLFDPFQRLHAASEFSGTGIGLATVSRVIKRHGGRIWAESAPAHGATFFFTLPQGEIYDAS
ncbi:MAG: PAS domain S-box protein [Burkholderiales bacterium]|nr:PAS domain S-box protein [Burkholderiales bacterium]